MLTSVIFIVIMSLEMNKATGTHHEKDIAH